VNYVQPIRDTNVVRDILTYLKNSNERNYILFMMGIYTGRRVTDILDLRIQDIKNKEYLNIKERKTRKAAKIDFTAELKKAIKDYCEGKPVEQYLVKSTKGANRPLSRQAAYKMLRDTAKKFGLEQIGTHTMRKTFGYHLYHGSGKDIVLVMNALGHTSESVTLRYIGITNEQVNTAIKKLKY